MASAADVVLIDTHTDKSGNREQLNSLVESWVATLKAAMPQLSDVDGEGKLGFYVLVCLPKSAATVVACLVTEALKCAYVLSDYSDQTAVAERVAPVLALWIAPTGATLPAALP